MTLPRTDAPGRQTASLRTRAGGYIVDMVIFAAIAMVITVFAGFILLYSTDWAEQDATDAQFYTFLAIIGLGVPIAWSALNLSLLLTRNQTGGQYVAGVRLRAAEDGRVLPREALAWWFCFNPLLFSWPMAVATGFPLAAVIALVLDRVTLIFFFVLVTVFIASPVIAFISAMLDADDRALHDRIAGVVAVPVE